MYIIIGDIMCVRKYDFNSVQDLEQFAVSSDKLMLVFSNIEPLLGTSVYVCRTYTLALRENQNGHAQF